jgi:GNAT superfamily N-acetyltransferase
MKPEREGGILIDAREGAPGRATMNVRPLTKGEEAGAGELLRAAPVRNVMLSSLLSEHGLDGARSRGRFYGCFRDGRLTGVALLGHFAMFSCGEEEARAFARVARREHADEVTVLLAGPREAAAFREVLPAPGGLCGCLPEAEPNIMLTLTDAAAIPDCYESGVRPATVFETDEVARLHAQCSLTLYGFDPMVDDPEGFGERVRERVRERRVWVSRDESGVTFKTDLAAQTGGVLYLEGVMTRPDLLGAGVGTREFGGLCRKLLRGYDTLCLLVAEGNVRAHDFYRRIGFREHSRHSIVRYHQRAVHHLAPAAPARAAAEGALYG